jgi:hypothetical protein
LIGRVVSRPWLFGRPVEWSGGWDSLLVPRDPGRQFVKAPGQPESHEGESGWAGRYKEA